MGQVGPALRHRARLILTQEVCPWASFPGQQRLSGCWVCSLCNVGAMGGGLSPLHMLLVGAGTCCSPVLQP